MTEHSTSLWNWTSRLNPKKHIKLSALAVPLILLGCASAAPPPQDQYFRLDVSPPNVSTAAPSTDNAPVIRGPLMIDLPIAQGMVGERPVLYTRADMPGQVQQYSYRYWEDSPPQLVHRTLISGLRSTKVAQSVVSPEIRDRYAATLSGRLLKFEQKIDGTSSEAHIQIELVLEDLVGQKVLWVKEFTVSKTVPTTEMNQTVAAFNMALQELVAQVSQEINKGYAP